VRALGLIAVLAASAALLAACGGSDKDEQRSEVNRYIEQENAVLRGAQHDFTALNEAYQKFSKGQLEPDKAIADLDKAERTIRGARADIAKLQPPADARALHDKVLHYLDVNVFLADETAKLAGYMPASAAALKPLAGVNKSLQTRLSDAKTASAQAGALKRFADALDRMLGKLDGLVVPQVLRTAHTDQMARLTTTRKLALELRGALLDQDAEAVAKLLKRFRANNSGQGKRSKLAGAALDHYTRRIRELDEAYAAVSREQQRLDTVLR
jgi:hypothetical protein